MLVSGIHPTRRLTGESGYSLVELMMLVAIVAVLGGMVAGVTTSYVSRSKADGAVLAALSTLELARNRAIAERRNFEITFQLPNRIIIERVEIVNGAEAGRTRVTDVLLENGLVFKKFPGIPDTPDLFGASSAIDFDGGAPIAFTSDGSLIDAAGDPSNGTVFLGQNTDDKTTARAITVMGATGLMKTFTWGGTQWIG